MVEKLSKQIPMAVRKYAEAMGLKVDDPRVIKYALGMRGRKADDEIIEGPTQARPVWDTEAADVEEEPERPRRQ